MLALFHCVMLGTVLVWCKISIFNLPAFRIMNLIIYKLLCNIFIVTEKTQLASLLTNEIVSKSYCGGWDRKRFGEPWFPEGFSYKMYHQKLIWKLVVIPFKQFFLILLPSFFLIILTPFSPTSHKALAEAEALLGRSKRSHVLRTSRLPYSLPFWLFRSSSHSASLPCRLWTNGQKERSSKSPEQQGSWLLSEL